MSETTTEKANRLRVWLRERTQELYGQQLRKLRCVDREPLGLISWIELRARARREWNLANEMFPRQNRAAVRVCAGCDIRRDDTRWTEQCSDLDNGCGLDPRTPSFGVGFEG